VALMPWRWLVFGAAVIALALVFGRKDRGDTVRVPADPNEVLEHVASASPGVKELRALEAALREQPDDPSRAAAAARSAISLARRESDPRYWGRAQAALQPWWSLSDPPPEVQTLRATIRQAQHDFDGARADLQRIIERDPTDAQAWLTLAVVERVTGNYDGARAACTHVTELEPLVPAVCDAQLDGLTGRAATGIERMQAELPGSRPGPERAGAEAVLGDLFERSGDDGNAETAWRDALMSDPDQAYARRALADLLLELGRPAEVEPLLASRLTDDNAVLRLAIAERMKLTKPGPYAQMLEARYRASEERGDTVHLREQARFALEVKGDAERALELAKRDCDVQKEPADLRIVMMAALAAGKPEAARPAADFVLNSGAQEPRLVALARRVRQ
jgi:tetratricopeptide (TPR) repeat protein